MQENGADGATKSVEVNRSRFNFKHQQGLRAFPCTKNSSKFLHSLMFAGVSDSDYDCHYSVAVKTLKRRKRF